MAPGIASGTLNTDAPVAAPRIDLLPFTLHDFTRHSWVSDRARLTWQPRMARILRAWMEIEWLSTREGIRECCYVFATPEDFLQSGVRWTELGLNSMPIEIQGILPGPYSSGSVPVVSGQPFQFRFVLGNPRSVLRFREAWKESDDDAIGELLGYPACCRSFFKDVWIDQGLVDTTWMMGVNSASASRGECCVDITMGAPEANILWRWVGVRAVSHLPCSFNCQATIEHARTLMELGRRNGYGSEMDWLLEMLQWPVEWSALHGVAEVKTPILKVSTRTDATARKYTLRYHGQLYPETGASGLRFPYHTSSRPVTDLVSFKRGIDNPIVELSLSPPWLADDNGFKSVMAMDAEHARVVTVANRSLSNTSRAVLDLGCGNGVLLKKLHRENATIIPFGIDSNAAAIAHSAELLPEFAGNLFVGDMFEDERIWADGKHYSLVLLMPGRCIEQPRDRSDRLRHRLATQCDHVLVYAYGDWIERYGSLRNLAEAAGLKLGQADATATAGLADVVLESSHFNACPK